MIIAVRSERDNIIPFLSMVVLIKPVYRQQFHKNQQTIYREQKAVNKAVPENRFLGIFHHGPSGGEMLIMLPGTVPNETKGSLFTQVMC
ncbi:hypothetical protein, partial [Methanoregula sp.]|uniref:hypothetical protein n=1 Tax=Methanoregula sp. TaxID=2052170 RepID=UPI0025FB064A